MVPAGGPAAWLRSRWGQGVVPVVGLEDPGRAGMADTAVRDSLGRPGQGLRCRLLRPDPAGPGATGREPSVYEKCQHVMPDSPARMLCMVSINGKGAHRGLVASAHAPRCR